MLKKYQLKIMIVLSFLIFFLGVFRIFFVVLYSPVLGYANNFDMIRIQSCHQIWPSKSDVDAGARTYEEPLEDYKFKNIGLGNCYPSSELFFTYLGEYLIKALQYISFLDDDNGFSVKNFGVLRGVFICLVSWFFLYYYALRKNFVLVYFYALFFSLVIADPANTLYLNTFYTEFSALFFCYLSVSMCFLLCNTGDYRSFFIGIFAISLCGLGFSKPQHIALPVVIFIAFLVGSYSRLMKIKFMVFLILVLVLGVTAFQAYFRQTNTMFSVNYANATDTFLWTVLPAATDANQAAKILGLPSSCIDHKGKNWYTPGIQEQHPCPEVLQVSRVRILWLSIHDPQFFLTVTRQGLAQLRPWLLQDIGSIGDRNLGFANELVFSFSDWLNKIPQKIFNAIFLMPIVIMIFGLIMGLKNKTSRSCGFVVFSLLVVLSYVVFYSSLFGDGYADLAKHSHLYFSVLAGLVIFCLSFLINRIASYLI